MIFDVVCTECKLLSHTRHSPVFGERSTDSCWNVLKYFDVTLFFLRILGARLYVLGVPGGLSLCFVSFLSMICLLSRSRWSLSAAVVPRYSEQIAPLHH